jgi:hypothetical protein
VFNVGFGRVFLHRSCFRVGETGSSKTDFVRSFGLDSSTSLHRFFFFLLLVFSLFPPSSRYELTNLRSLSPPAAGTTVDNEPLSSNFNGLLGLALPLNSVIAQNLPPVTNNDPDGAAWASNLFSITPVDNAPLLRYIGEFCFVLSFVLSYPQTPPFYRSFVLSLSPSFRKQLREGSTSIRSS